MSATIRIIAALVLAAPAAIGQSLWNEHHRTRPLWTDVTAQGVGDIITIIIDESNVVENDEETRLEKQSTLSALISNFDIIPDLFNTLPRAEAQQSRSMDGKAEYDKDNRFRTKISVVVVDELPNGNLLIEGTRRLFVDGETKTITISGMIRPYDIAKNNTIRSEFVANASISYEGDGFMTRTTTRGWFTRLLDIVWPF